MLRSRGAKPVSVPVMRLQALLDEDSLRELGEGISRGRWDDVVFTSANAVRLLLPSSSDSRPPVRIFAIGPGTAAAVRESGWPVQSLPSNYIAESLAEHLVAQGVRGRRVLLPRAQAARQVLPTALAGAGAELELVDLYRMTPDPGSRSALDRVMADPALDCILFTSGSSVECFRTLWGPQTVSGSVLIACIGPITATAAKASGMAPGLIAEEHSLAGLVDALEMRLGPLPENDRQP
jgi:uroporphyrinogen-III synthase